MSPTRQVVQGTLRLLSGQILARIVDFGIYLLLARGLGVEGFGSYTFALSFALLFNVVTDLGVSIVLTREAARSPERTRELLRDAMLLKLAGGTAAVLAMLAIAAVTGTALGALGLIAAAGVSLALRSVTLLTDGLLKAAGRAGSVGVGTLAGSVASLAVAWASIANGAGPMGAVVAWGAGGIAHLAVSAWLARDLVRAGGGHDGAAFGNAGPWAMLREALPLALSWAFIALYFRIDAVMLQAMAGEHAVGLYGSVYRVFETFTMVAVAYRSVLFPVMARAADGPPEALAVLCRKSIRLHLAFTVLVAVFITFHAGTLVRVALGAGYAEAAPGLAVLIWALPGSFVADTLLHLLIAQRRQAAGTWVVGATAALNVGLNLVLIPRHGFVGAAAATVASEAACCGLLLVLFRRGVPGIGIVRTAWRPIVAGGLLAGTLALVAPRLPADIPGLATGILVALAGYGGALLLLGGITRDDLALARSLLPAPVRAERD